MTDRCERLKVLVSMPGWLDLISIADEMSKEHRDYLEHLMVSKPNDLTGKTAIARANRARGIKDLMDAVQSEIRDPQSFVSSKGQGRSGTAIA